MLHEALVGLVTNTVTSQMYHKLTLLAPTKDWGQSSVLADH